MIYWIDTAVGVAYVRVLGALSHFSELLTVFDSIFADLRHRGLLPHLLRPDRRGHSRDDRAPAADMHGGVARLRP